MQKISPHLWFDKEAKEAAALYTSLFPNSSITTDIQLHNTPSGSVDILTIELAGQEFNMINAGPLFKFNPSVSFLINCATEEEVETLWKTLSEGSKKTLMELGEYPFSKKYGWLQDKFGVSWQIMLAQDSNFTQKIIPTIMFVGEQAGHAKEAIELYTSVFHNSSIDSTMFYPAGASPDKEGTIQHAGFTLEDIQFAAMDSALDHQFSFNEAISFIVHCKDQAELDYYWEKLSADPSAEQCGWLKDKFGLSWQIDSVRLNEMMKTKDPAQLERVTQAFLKMKKFDIAKLEEAYRG